MAQAPFSTHSIHTPRPEVSPSLEVVHALENFLRTVNPLPEICRHEAAPLLWAVCGPLESRLGALPQPSHPRTILSPCPPTWVSGVSPPPGISHSRCQAEFTISLPNGCSLWGPYFLPTRPVHIHHPISLPTFSYLSVPIAIAFRKFILD